MGKGKRQWPRLRENDSRGSRGRLRKTAGEVGGSGKPENPGSGGESGETAPGAAETNFGGGGRKRAKNDSRESGRGRNSGKRKGNRGSVFLTREGGGGEEGKQFGEKLKPP